MIDERSRHSLFLRLEELLGPEEATTLMEYLPPVGWADVATKRDLDHLSTQLATTTTLLRQEMASSTALLRQEMSMLRQEMDGNTALLREEFATSEQRTDASMLRQLNAQTRTMIFGMVGVALSISTVSLFQ